MQTDAPSSVNSTAIVAVVVAVIAAFLSIFALGRALSDTGGGGAAERLGDASAPVGVTLSEFAVAPAMVQVPVGGSLAIANNGVAEHDFVIEGGPRTALIAAGASSSLDVSSLTAGSYGFSCTVPGHAEAGMKGTLVVGGDAVDAADASMDHGATGTGAQMQAAMVAMMQESIGAFPAETEGVGATVLEPIILDDGTLLFELVADEVQWEVEPGKVVDAVGYNGMVPGPTMYVPTGSNVTIRIVNNLDDEGTSLHPHGLKDHAFELDGVTFISQDPIAPGDAMDYTFLADQESVVGYHSHHMSLHQVPNGLFGMMIVGDYAALAGFDVVDEQVMVLNDAGNIGYSLNGKSFPATAPFVYTEGDKVLVHYANEGQMAHPMHLHNQTGTVIAKDGYLLQPSARWQGDTFNIAPGERLTVVYDMKTPGTWVWHCHILSHVKRSDGSMFGMLTAVIIQEREAA